MSVSDTQIGVDLLNMLGIPTDYCKRIELVVEVGRLPQLTVHRELYKLEGLEPKRWSYTYTVFTAGPGDSE